MKYKVPSRKSEDILRCQTYLEVKTVITANFDPSIFKIQREGIKIPYTYLNKNRNYIPDFKFTLIDGQTIIIECKPESKVDDPQNVAKFTASRRWCKDRGYTFLIITDKLFTEGYTFKNIKFLTRYSRSIVYKSFSARIVDELELGGKMRLKQLSKIMGGDFKQSTINIYSLLYNGIIVTNLEDSLISLNSWIYLPNVKV